MAPSTRSLLVSARVSTSLMPGMPYSFKYSSIESSARQLLTTGESSRTTKPEHFGAPAKGVHAVQIEIARSLYLDERTIVRTRKWTVLRDDLFAAAKALAHEFGGESEPRRLAAE